MDDQNQNCTVNPSLNSTPTNPTVSPALLGSPRTTNTDIVPVVTDSVGGNSAPVGSQVVLKRKRGRPRKNDVSRNLLSPATAPSGFPASSFGSSSKRGRGRPKGYLILLVHQLVVGSFKQNISSEIKRRLSPGFSGAANSHDEPSGAANSHDEPSGAANSHDEPSGAANTHDEPDPLAMSLQVPKMIEAEHSLPSPTSGLMPTTTNGLPVRVMTGTSNGMPNNVTSSSTNNGVPVNFFHENPQNMNPASLNGIGLDRQNMQPVTNQMTFGDVNNSASNI